MGAGHPLFLLHTGGCRLQHSDVYGQDGAVRGFRHKIHRTVSPAQCRRHRCSHRCIRLADSLGHHAVVAAKYQKCPAGKLPFSAECRDFGDVLLQHSQTPQGFGQSVPMLTRRPVSLRRNFGDSRDDFVKLHAAFPPDMSPPPEQTAPPWEFLRPNGSAGTRHRDFPLQIRRARFFRLP